MIDLCAIFDVASRTFLPPLSSFGCHGKKKGVRYNSLSR